MVEYTAVELENLKSRWTEHREALRKLIPVIKREKNWSSSDAYEVLSRALGPPPGDLRVVERDLRGVNLDDVDLTGADLRYADLYGANLTEANLSGADLGEANLAMAYLWNANLSGANLWEANLSGADLRYANLSEALLTEAHLPKANLWEADLSGANLEKADLSGANIEGVSYTTDGAFNRLKNWWIPRVLCRVPLVRRHSRKPVGITHLVHLETTKIDFSKNAFLKRDIEDYQFIQALKHRNWSFRWIIYPLWKGTSDCGRSLALWILWAALQIAAFGWIYASSFSSSSSPLPKLLSWAMPQIYLDPQQYHHGFWTPLYFSLATFTTSGFYGAVQLQNAAALFWTSLEVILGYIMLGGLIAVFANKLARRA